MKLYLEHKGSALHCSPIRISPNSTILELKKQISQLLGEDLKDIELRRMDTVLSEDETQQLGQGGVGLRDRETIDVVLPLASVTRTGDADQLVSSIRCLNIEDMSGKNLKDEKNFGEVSGQSCSSVPEYDINLLEEPFENISCEPNQSKVFLGKIAKVTCSPEHQAGCKFQARLTPPKIFDEIVSQMGQEEQDWVICSPMMEIINIAEPRKVEPYCSLSLRQFLFLPKDSHAIKTYEGDEHFIVRVFKASDGKWKFSRIEDGKVKEHSISWAFTDCSHVCEVGQQCRHPFHLELFFLRTKSDLVRTECRRHEVDVHVVVRHVDHSYNEEEWDNPRTIEESFRRKYLKGGRYEEATNSVEITIPGGGIFSLDVGIQEGLEQVRQKVSSQQMVDRIKPDLYEKCGTVAITSISKENGSQLLAQMENLFPYDKCCHSRQKMFAQMRAKEADTTHYANPDQLFLRNGGEGLPLRIIDCMTASSSDKSNEIEETAAAAKYNYKDFAEGKTFEKLRTIIKPFFEGCQEVAELRDPQEGRTMSSTTINNFNIGGTFNQTNNTMNILAPLHPHFFQLIGTGQKQFLENVFKEQGLTTLDGFPGTETSLIKFETILNSVCMIEGGSSATGFIAKIPNHGVAFMTAGHCFKDKTLLPLNELQTSIDFNNYLLHFGNSTGNPTFTETCKLADLGPFRGSIGYQGKRLNFPGNSPGNANQYEDYCALLFDDTKLTKFNLSYFECGEGGYLKHRQDGVVSIFGHPGEGCMEGQNRPLRVSYGKEKTADSKGSAAETSGNFLLYDNDTLPGNSGSPVIGRGDSNGKYAIKGIHVTGIAAGQTNGAQSLINLSSWISPEETAKATVPVAI